MAVFYGLSLSTGSVSAIQRQVSEALRVPVVKFNYPVHRFIQLPFSSLIGLTL